jgi:hypothetical protein
MRAGQTVLPANTSGQIRLTPLEWQFNYDLDLANFVEPSEKPSPKLDRPPFRPVAK